MLKVGHFMPHYPSLTGTSSYCSGLCSGLSKIPDIDVVVLTTRNDGRVPIEDVPVRCYPRSKSLNPFRIPAELVEAIEKNNLNLDGMVVHGTFSPAATAMARLCRRCNIPYIFMPHDPYVKELRNHHKFRKIIWWHLFERITIRDAVAVQLLDQGHELALLNLGVKTKTFVAPNGCDPRGLKDTMSTFHLVGCDEPMTILYLGRMDRNHKGLDLLLEGYAKFLKIDGMPATRLVLTGNDWEDREFLESLARDLRIFDCVSFTGPRKESAVTIAGEADLVVLTSRFEGFGLTIVEGMLAGRPVMVSDQAGVATHVLKSGGGWLVRPNSDAIAAKLSEIFRRCSELSTRGEAGQRYVLENLTWEKSAQLTAEGYRAFFR